VGKDCDLKDRTCEKLISIRRQLFNIYDHAKQDVIHIAEHDFLKHRTIQIKKHPMDAFLNSN
jgi:hypothetical protein